MNERLKLYRNFFTLVDERTELKLFKKYLMELLELAEAQNEEIEKLRGLYSNSSSIEERWNRVNPKGENK